MGWAFSVDRETVPTTVPALRMAFTKRAAQTSLLFHTDRGCSSALNRFVRPCVQAV